MIRCHVTTKECDYCVFLPGFLDKESDSEQRQGLPVRYLPCCTPLCGGMRSPWAKNASNCTFEFGNADIRGHSCHLCSCRHHIEGYFAGIVVHQLLHVWGTHGLRAWNPFVGTTFWLVWPSSGSALLLQPGEISLPGSLMAR